MENYTQVWTAEVASLFAFSFQEQNEHEWYIVHSLTTEGQYTDAWKSVRDAFIK